MQEGLSVINLPNPAPIHDEQHLRLEVKLRRELGEQVLSLLADDRTEDILDRKSVV